MDPRCAAELPQVDTRAQTRTQSYTRLRTGQRRLYRRQMSTKTLLGMFIGFSITYGSYFVVTASGESSLNEQPETVLRSEAAVPLDLPPEGGAEGADPARAGATEVLSESVAGTSTETSGEKAAEEEEETETLPAGVQGPSDHLANSLEEAWDEAGGEESKASKEDEAEQAAKAKKGLLKKIKGAFSRKESKEQKSGEEEQEKESEASAPEPKLTEDEAVENGAEKRDAGEDAKETDEDAEGADEDAEETGEDAEEAKAFAGADEAATSTPTVEVRPVVHETGPRIAVRQAISEPVDENIITVRGDPSPQDASCRTLIFDASKSHDPDNDNLTYEWDFGDGSEKATVVRVRHTFPKSGEYPVTLKVTDNSNGQCAVSKNQQMVSVNTAPIAVGAFPLKLAVGETGLFDGRLSEDTAGDRLSYEWDFGDGSPKVSGPVVPHRYKETGEYRVLLTAKDNSESACDTGVVASTVLVEDSMVEERLVFRLEQPEPVRPRLRAPQVAAPTPLPPPVEDTHAEMEGLLVQIRDHQEEEKPAPQPAVEEPQEVAVMAEAPPPVTPAAIPVMLVSTENPVPERAETPPPPRFIPDTHRNVLAWAGGYLVHCPSVGCQSENKVSFRSRVDQDIQRLLKTVIDDQEKLHRLMRTDSNHKEALQVHGQEIAQLGVKLNHFRKESVKANGAQIAQLSRNLTGLSQEVDLSHRKLLGITVRNTEGLQTFGNELLQHTRDERRHRTEVQSPGTEIGTSPAREVEPMPLQGLRR